MQIMPLTDEQAKTIKEQIINQIESTFPEDKRESATKYIEALNNEQLEEFIKKNRLIKENGEGEIIENGGEKECIMCLISAKKIESRVIYEDDGFLGVLELNPVSEGHTILIPKKHIEHVKELPREMLEIEEKIGKHLIKKLDASEFKLAPSEELGHAVVNIIPVYGDAKLERKSAKKEELIKLKEKIGEISAKKEQKVESAAKREEPEKKIEIAEEKVKPSIIKLNRRIP